MNIEQYLNARTTTAGAKHAKRSAFALKPFESFRQGREVTQALLVDFQLHLQRQGLSTASINRYCTEVRSMLSYFRRRGECRHISRDQAGESLQMLKVARRLPRVWSPEEVHAIIRALQLPTIANKKSLRAYVLVGLATGMRPGELRAIRKEDVNQDLQEIRVMATKTGVERRVPYSDSPAVAKMIDHIMKWHPGPKLLHGFRDSSWRKLLEDAKIPYCEPRVLRATAATYVACSNTYNEYMLCARFGHSTAVAIKHYRVPNFQVQGATLEEWLGCADRIRSLADQFCRSVPCTKNTPEELEPAPCTT